MSEQLLDLKRYIGRSVTANDVVTASPVARLAATLGIAPPASASGDPLPPGWHGLYFLPSYGPENMRADGSASGGAMAPPVTLPRYRLGLDRAEFPSALCIGDALSRTSKISDVSISEEAAGPVVTVMQRHEITGPRGLAVVEEREFIYFDKALPLPPAPRLPAAIWRNTVEPNPVLLFRFSALRFNSHRVHYDRDYATKEEGLPGLIVHATLICQLLIEMCRTMLPERRLIAFSPRTRHPIYDTAPFALCGAPAADGRSATLWALDAAGSVSLVGEATFSTES